MMVLMKKGQLLMWKALQGCTVIFLLLLLLYKYSTLSNKINGIYSLPFTAQEPHKFPGIWLPIYTPPSGHGLQKDVPWWEANDCQCKTKECTEPSVTFKGLLKGEVGGTCGRRAWSAGDGQRVLTMSLFGTNSGYWKGLEEIFPQVEELYPGWKVRLYTNPRHYAAVLCPLMHRYSSLLYICDVTNLPYPLGNLSNHHPMMWRDVTLGDPQVAAMLVRDTDSSLGKREQAAVKEWLASGKVFHVMRDHPRHIVPILGGMWGARWDIDPAFAGELTTVRNKMIALAQFHRRKRVDQDILEKLLWPLMAGKVLAHDSYKCAQFNGSSPWPTQRMSSKDFVGSPRLRSMHLKNYSGVPGPCPMKCRPPAHQDWKYC